MHKHYSNAHPQDARGFTLVELMVTVAVAAIILGIAVPSFRDMSIRNQLASYSNDVIAAVNYARSEAIRRGGPVSICPTSDDGASCSGDWNDGWMVFFNANGDNPAVRDDVDDEPLLKLYGPVANNYSLAGDATLAGGLTYGGDGAAVTTGVIAVCYEDALERSRAIVITRLRPRMATDTDADLIPNRDEGAGDPVNITSCDNPSGV